MSNFVFSAAARSSIRSELRAFVNRTGAVYVELVDEAHDEEDVVTRAGELRDIPTEEQELGLQSYSCAVLEGLSVSAWIPTARSIDVLRRELDACAFRLRRIGERAWLERRIWVGLAASWRCDDVGPRSDASFAQLRVLGPTRVAGRRPHASDNAR